MWLNFSYKKSHYLNKLLIGHSKSMSLAWRHFSIHLCTLCQFYPITSPVFLTKTNELLHGRKENFLYIWLLQSITTCQRGQKIASLDTVAFMYWQSSRTIIFLCKHYIVVSDILQGSLMRFSLFVGLQYC